VTGDSNGRINFYNGKLGALVQSIRKHKRDILTIAASKNERMVFASGVDPLVLAYENIRVGESDFEGKQEEWRRVWGHVLHANDVRQLEIVDREVVSAGVDRNIVVARQKKAANDNSKSSSILQSYRQSPVCSVSKEARLFLLQGSCQLDLWKMADAAALEDGMIDEDEERDFHLKILIFFLDINFCFLKKYPGKGVLRSSCTHFFAENRATESVDNIA